MATTNESLASVGAETHWPLERILFALAGTMVLVSAFLAAVVSPWFLLLTAFVGINQWLYVAFGACPASLVLNRMGVAASCKR
jgi:hypothetical protein